MCLTLESVPTDLFQIIFLTNVNISTFLLLQQLPCFVFFLMYSLNLSQGNMYLLLYICHMSYTKKTNFKTTK